MVKERRARSSIAKLLSRTGIGTVGFFQILITIGIAVSAPVLAPQDPFAINAFEKLHPPSRSHLMGTDHLGRDVLSRVVYGARVSLEVGVIAVVIATSIGGSLGLIAGYFGASVDNALMRVMDIMLAFPPILLAISITAVLGPGITNAMIAIGVVYTPRFARLARAPVLTLRHLEYVEAARAVGASHLRIISRHILPNAVGPLIVQISLAMASAILAEAALGFLGLGAQPPIPSWGGILNEGRLVVEIAPWLAIFPGAAIVFAVLGFNLLGDGVRDLLDPRLR